MSAEEGVELLEPVPPPPRRVAEEWAEPEGYGWLQLGKCWYAGHGEPDAEAREWELVRRSSDDTTGRASATASSQAIDIIATLRRSGRPDALVLVLVYRPPVDQWVIEMPAGMIDPGEAPEAAARRELTEETGYTAQGDGEGGGALLPTALCWPDPWKSRENYYACQLRIDGDAAANSAEGRRSAQSLERGEHIVPLLAPLCVPCMCLVSGRCPRCPCF